MQVQMLAVGAQPAPAIVQASGSTLALAGAPAAAAAARPPLPGPFTIIATVIRTQGLHGLWLGHTGTLIREVGGGAAWFATKQFVSGLFLAHRAKKTHTSLIHDPSNPNPTPIVNSGKELRPWESAISGACAGMAYNLILFPADSVKSFMQTEAELRPTRPGAAAGPRPTFLGVFRSIYATRGIKGLYAGCGITVARAAPSSALIFMIYDALDKRFG